MKTLHDNPFSSIVWKPESRTLHVTRKAQTESMTDKEYQLELDIWARLSLDTRPAQQLIDQRQMRFAVAPAVQELVQRRILEVVAQLGIERVAIVRSDDIFAMVSVEQLVDEMAVGFELRQFDHLAEAEAWLGLA